LLERYHIPPEERRDDSSFLLYRNLTALFEDTVQTLNYPQLGLKLAEYQGMDILGPISVIARSAATVGDAIDSIARYLHLHSPALGISNTLCEHQEQPCIRFQFTIDESSSGGYRPQAYELSLSNSLQVMKLLCGDTFRLYSVHFMHARQAELDAYHDVFRCDAYFEQDWCGFYLPAAAFAMPQGQVLIRHGKTKWSQHRTLNKNRLVAMGTDCSHQPLGHGPKQGGADQERLDAQILQTADG
jgi:hypothetical protein